MDPSNQDKHQVDSSLWKKLSPEQRLLVRSTLCGAVAGIVAKTAIAPLERIKMSFQVSHEHFTYPAAFARFKSYVQHGGLLSLWKGHSTTIIRVAPYAGISYAGHDYAEKKLKSLLKTSILPIHYKFLAGSFAGISGTLFTYPLDVLRVRLALIPHITWTKALKQGGFFQGVVPTLVGIVPYSGTAWMMKQVLLEAFPKFQNRQPNLLESLVLNALAGIAAQFVTYPLDIARRRMQMEILEHGEPSKLSIMSIFRTLLLESGPRGLYKGFSLNIVKGPITLSLSLTTFDLLKKWMEPFDDDCLHKAPETSNAGGCNRVGKSVSVVEGVSSAVSVNSANKQNPDEGGEAAGVNIEKPTAIPNRSSVSSDNRRPSDERFPPPPGGVVPQ